jgi:transposase
VNRRQTAREFGLSYSSMRMISDKRPEQLKLDFALWTWAAVMLLIERECGVRLPVRSVGQYLQRCGFTP